MHTSSRGGLASLSLSMLLAALGTSIANVGLPSLVKAFDASFHAVQWVVLAYLMAITLVIVSAGRLGDRLGRRRLLLAGLLLFALACGLCSAAPTLNGLIAARALQGLGAAVMMAMALGMVGDTVPPERTGRAMGLLGTLSAVGTALGPSVGGGLVSLWGWRALFLAGAPLGLAAFVLAWRCLPLDRRNGRLPAQAGFWRALEDASLRSRLVMSALVSAVIMATFVVGPFYLSQGLGLAPEWMGLAMAVGPCVAALTGVPAGRLTDRLGSRHTTFAGLGTLLGGALLLALASGLPAYLGSLVILTAGYSLFQTANNTAVMKAARGTNRGTLSGWLNLSRNLGLIGGASALGTVFAWATPDVTHGTPQSVADGLHTTFGVAAGLILLALAIARGRVNSPQHANIDKLKS
ncbi:MFS transporter [Pseudomonas fluorescens]|uniref:MFS transporter n=1 Tax=Pseudomonas fluorescens TaxID=294 RepID=A0A7Z6MZR9_PSEFL|nr:MFS transporter [Pseudomonas fluorescens]RDS91918.1 MFS transporter [Pseudomonas fluorescens]